MFGLVVVGHCLVQYLLMTLGTLKEKPHREMSAWDAARENGCDMALLEDNLRRTPNERIRLHQKALRAVTMLHRAGEKSSV